MHLINVMKTICVNLDTKESGNKITKEAENGAGTLNFKRQLIPFEKMEEERLL